MSRHIVIVGGGVIGSAIASFALADPAFRGKVTVVERDPTYARASSALSASSIRQQFSTAINVEIGRAHPRRRLPSGYTGDSACGSNHESYSFRKIHCVHL